MGEELARYSIITDKNPREIVLLRGSGCKWRRCRFCNYHLDYSKSVEDNFALNSIELDRVTGIYGRLEVINSGSFLDLDEQTIQKIIDTCKNHNITDIHFECHWLHREEIQSYRKRLEDLGIRVHIKSGVETFDVSMREDVFDKGFGDATPQEIATYFDDVCLLQGVVGQTIESMENDIETGLKYFDRVCINIMVENGMPIKPDNALIQEFITTLYPKYKDLERVDILIDNTDFGVGGVK